MADSQVLWTLLLLTVLGAVKCDSDKFVGPEPFEVYKQYIKFIYYDKSVDNNVTIEITKPLDVLAQPGFDLKKKTVFYLAGLGAQPTDEPSLVIISKYLELGTHNVIQIDWSRYSDNDFTAEYLIAIGSVDTVAYHCSNSMKEMFKNGLDCNQTEVVGHSLGAMATGYIGNYTNGVISVLVGLDPAGPLNFVSPLRSGAGRYVVGMHTNSGFLGTSAKPEDCSFIPNGGSHQPGCPFIGDTRKACSHNRAKYMWGYMVTRPELFYGVKCRILTCDNSTVQELSPYNRLNGSYYFDSDDDPPYGLGMAGVKHLRLFKTQ